MLQSDWYISKVIFKKEKSLKYKNDLKITSAALRLIPRISLRDTLTKRPSLDKQIHFFYIRFRMKFQLV